MTRKAEEIHHEARVRGYVVGHLDGATVYRHIGEHISAEDAKSMVKDMSSKDFAEYIKTYDKDASEAFMQELSDTMGLDVFGAYIDDDLCIRQDGHECDGCAMKSGLCDIRKKVSLREYWDAEHRNMLTGKDGWNGRERCNTERSGQ